jgi:hypothetical protein
MADSNPAIGKLEQDYRSLLLGAALLKHEFEVAQQLGGIELDDSILPSLAAIGSGYVSTAISREQPISVHELAKRILEEPTNVYELVIVDFEAYVHWLSSKDPQPAVDSIRERIIKRRTLLEAVLPESMWRDVVRAFAHTERMHLRKSYVNDETMCGDSIEDIPKQKFFVSEDNYAWDLGELVQCIAVNGGIMRNPLSKEMFTETDIHMIISHPLGKRLRAQKRAQQELKNGVRTETIQKVGELGQAMLKDQSGDAAEARKAMDEFLAFAATLPDSEQQTLQKLKIPATDRHTGQPYDYTIGDSIGDAKANTTCFHKVSGSLTAATARCVSWVGLLT